MPEGTGGKRKRKLGENMWGIAAYGDLLDI